jgi:hypothetical protein
LLRPVPSKKAVVVVVVVAEEAETMSGRWWSVFAMSPQRPWM